MFQLINAKSGININNTLLLIFSFFLIFLVPILPESSQNTVYNVLFSFIFFLAILSLQGKARKRLLVVAIIAFVTEWIAEIFQMNVLRYISSITNIIFFQVIVARLIFQIANNKKVNSGVILESVNAYLLLGLMFTFLVAILHLYNPDSFSNTGSKEIDFQHFIYYTFVTLSTLGYGDIIPQEPLSRSLSILISVSGQLYIAIIIAMLVGKFSGTMAASKKE